MISKRPEAIDRLPRLPVRAGCAVALWLVVVLNAGAAAQVTNAVLAAELARDSDHAGSAVEFRRLGLGAAEPSAKAGYFWAAAYEYEQSGRHDLAEKLLDRAEDAFPGLGLPGRVLRGESAASAGAADEAEFHFRAILEADAPGEAKTWAARRLAALRLTQRDVSGAEAALAASPAADPEGEEALRQYAAGRDKRPMVGGLLGIVPGLGYAYAGEYATGLRSLLLNSLFIFGMVNTADRDQWGAFGVISFFEVTWFTGSIYGGVDASHRYNQRRIEDCTREIDGTARFEPDLGVLPIVSLRFTF